MDVQRGELTCAALGEKAVRVPSAFGVLPIAAGRARRGGKLPWKKSSEVSFHRDSIFSEGTEGQCHSVCTPMGASSWAGLPGDQWEIGTIPIVAIVAS